MPNPEEVHQPLGSNNKKSLKMLQNLWHILKG